MDAAAHAQVSHTLKAPLLHRRQNKQVQTRLIAPVIGLTTLLPASSVPWA